MNNIFTLFILFYSVFLSSCTVSTSKSTDRVGGPDRQTTAMLNAHRAEIRRVTDKILLALATRDYDLLGSGTAGRDSFIKCDRNITGRQIAVQLLGPNAFTIILERWNADQVAITFDDNHRWATATIPVQYRQATNRKPQTNIFTFRFHYSPTNKNWQLSLHP